MLVRTLDGSHWTEYLAPKYYSPSRGHLRYPTYSLVEWMTKKDGSIHVLTFSLHDEPHCLRDSIENDAFSIGSIRFAMLAPGSCLLCSPLIKQKTLWRIVQKASISTEPSHNPLTSLPR